MTSHIEPPTKETQLSLPEIPALIEIKLSVPQAVVEQLDEQIQEELKLSLHDLLLDLITDLHDSVVEGERELVLTPRLAIASAYYLAWKASKGKGGNIPVEALVVGAQLSLMASQRLKIISGAWEPYESEQGEDKEETGH